MIDADPHGAVMLFASFYDGHKAIFNSKSLIDVFLLTVFHLVGVAMKNKETWIYTYFINVLCGFHGNSCSLVVDVSRKWNVLVPFGHLCPNRFHRFSFTQAWRCNTHQLAAFAM
jgi:hypothetical protein